MKHEWKKEEKTLYLPKQTPALMTVPKLNFLTISGKGDPNNNEVFSAQIGALYALSFTIKMMPKSGFVPNGYYEYTVYPLEGVWDMDSDAKNFSVLNKEDFIYTIMIRQPDFVDSELVRKTLESVKKKKPNPYLDEVQFEEIEDGFCVQMMHVGPFDDEPASFEKMADFMAENGLERRTMTHREIYLSDFRRAKSSNLKTVLRCFVREKDESL